MCDVEKNYRSGKDGVRGIVEPVLEINVFS
jgi:hypothetical protein